ncbi:MAG: WYL domain-containing protein [Crocinitomicaceae bacterium]|nr:WYL domain-containing protein [Crocinitomicaceae bacterium]
MSKRAYISRYLLIVKKLKAKPYSSFKELHEYLESQFEYLQMQDENLNISFSVRTFQRDKIEIRNMFGIDIDYSREVNGYFIVETDSENMNFQRMMESFDIFNSLNIGQEQIGFIQLEKRRPQGTEHIFGLLHAIKNHVLVKFTYQKFWEDVATLRSAEPLALKEFRNRWYLVAKDNKDNHLKTFALDRLSNLDITTKKFKFPKDFVVEEKFKYSFGIITPSEEDPQEIILSFNSDQGKYVKSLPLHETQEVMIDTPEELRIKLKLFVTHDLMMELLSFGDNLKVLKPKSLVNKIKLEHQKAYKKYL